MVFHTPSAGLCSAQYRFNKNDSPLLYESNHTVLGFNFWGLSGNGPVAGLVQGVVKRFCTQFCPSVQFVDQALDFNRVNQSLYHNNMGCKIPI